jgi:hypothetical protein
LPWRAPVQCRKISSFILEKIDSVAQLEALLLMRANRDEEWSAGTLAKRLYISESETAAILTALSARDFLQSGSDTLLFRYKPSSLPFQLMVDRLAELYAKQLVPITNLIHSKAKTRVQKFADAFRFTKDG